ncbi:MAG: YdeI/OmpD-associated family protein [Leucobacter sp.]
MTLRRPTQHMPDDIEEMLTKHRLRNACDERPAYQRNDYLAWVVRAKRPETRTKRVNQMLRELKEGGIYMGMQHPPSQR